MIAPKVRSSLTKNCILLFFFKVVNHLVYWGGFFWGGGGGGGNFQKKIDAHPSVELVVISVLSSPWGCEGKEKKEKGGGLGDAAAAAGGDAHPQTTTGFANTWQKKNKTSKNMHLIGIQINATCVSKHEVGPP